MPNIKSSVRSVKTDELRRARNFPIKTVVRNATRKVVEVLDVAKIQEAQTLLVKATSALDNAVRKGVLHKNAAARKKSRLAKAVNKLAQ